MTNPYFVNSLDLIAGNKARASEVESNLSAVEAGFDVVATDFATRDAAIALKAPLASPAFTGTPTAPTAAAGTATTQLATALFVQNAIAAAAALSLPTIVGNANKFLFTDGATVSWQQAYPSVTGNERKSLRVISGVPAWSTFMFETPIIVSGNTNATVGVPHVIIAAAVITLPASPTAGDVVPFRKKTAAGVAVSFARNTKPIETLAEDLVLDGENDAGILVYADATRGWLIFQG